MRMSARYTSLNNFQLAVILSRENSYCSLHVSIVTEVLFMETTKTLHIVAVRLDDYFPFHHTEYSKYYSDILYKNITQSRVEIKQNWQFLLLSSVSSVKKSLIHDVSVIMATRTVLCC